MIAASADLLAELPLAAACAVLGLGRGSYYRSLGKQASEGSPGGREREDEAALLAAVEQVVLEFPGYGYLRVTHQLRREGFCVNPKRIYRLMGEAGWLHLRKRGRVRTTNSDHGLPIYPNLLPACGWRALTGPNQAWGADLTYVRLGDGFCYLAVLLDLFSRRIVGWDLAGEPGSQGSAGSPGEGVGEPATGRGVDPPLGSGRAVRLSGVRAAVEAGAGEDQHGWRGSAEGERAHGAVDADGEGRGGGPGGVSDVPGSQARNRSLH